MNNLKIIIALFILLPFTTNKIRGQAQYPGFNVQLDSCHSCLLGESNYQVGGRFTLMPENIISDFGPRNHSSYWHGGIDFTIDSLDDQGYHVLSVEDGYVGRIRGNTGQKYSETIGANRLMYNHCFTSATVPSNGELRQGDVALIELDSYTGGAFYKYGIIVYGDSDTTLIAACPARNCTNFYEVIGHDTIFAVDAVSVGTIIGSVGTSFSSSSTARVASHLHLQRFKTQRPGSGYSSSNVLNPAEVMAHPQPSFDVEILGRGPSVDGAHPGFEINYPGDIRSQLISSIGNSLCVNMFAKKICDLFGRYQYRA